MILLKKKNFSYDNHIIYLSLFQMYKSYLLLISDQENMGIGNVTLSSPPTIEGLNSTSASYNLFGMKEKLLSKIIAEKASNMLKAPVLSLLFLKNINEEDEIAKPLSQFLNTILDEVIKDKNQN
ncbi:MAG: hypothetical protein ACFFBP_09840 [Promethearchaeota archaeon]